MSSACPEKRLATTPARQVRLEVLMRPEIRAAADKELPPDYPPADFGLPPGDEYMLTSGGMKGLRGFFTRDHSGAVVGIDLAGRLYSGSRRPRSDGADLNWRSGGSTMTGGPGARGAPRPFTEVELAAIGGVPAGVAAVRCRAADPVLELCDWLRGWA
jgi:hypothetical protein